MNILTRNQERNVRLMKTEGDIGQWEHVTVHYPYRSYSY